MTLILLPLAFFAVTVKNSLAYFHAGLHTSKNVKNAVICALDKYTFKVNNEDITTTSLDVVLLSLLLNLNMFLSTWLQLKPHQISQWIISEISAFLKRLLTDQIFCGQIPEKSQDQPILAQCFISIPLKTPETSDVFRGYRNGVLG